MSNETANMDFKYVLQDFNNVYIGARLTFAELCEQDDTPQRLCTAVFQYVIPEVGDLLNTVWGGGGGGARYCFDTTAL